MINQNDFFGQNVFFYFHLFFFCTFESIAKEDKGEIIEISSLSIENRAQILLFDLGYEIEKNGIFDEKTKSALKQFYIDVGP